MELFKLYQNFFTSYIQFLHSGSQSIPCVYGLLPDTRQATYTSFLETLKQADATLNPGTVSTDYEKAATNAFHAVIPDTSVQGCLYCLSHCAYYRVQAQGLQQDYATNHELSLQIRMIPAMAFVPVVDIPATFEALQDESPVVYNLLLIVLKMCSLDKLDAMVG